MPCVQESNRGSPGVGSLKCRAGPAPLADVQLSLSRTTETCTYITYLTLLWTGSPGDRYLPTGSYVLKNVRLRLCTVGMHIGKG